MTLSDLITRMWELREERRAIAERDKELSREISEIEPQIIALMDEQGVTRTANDRASVAISEDTFPSVQDWDAFYEFIVSTNQPYLQERRPSVSAFRESLAAGINWPGVEAFTKRKINLRTI